MKHPHWFALAVLVAAAASATVAAQQTPSFRSSVEVTSVDVTVVDGSGHPVSDLTPNDFTVKVNGASRRVLTAQWIPLSPPPGAPAPPVPPEGYSTNQMLTTGRLIVIAVDEPSIRAGNGSAVLRATEDFVDRLQPADRAAAVSLGAGSVGTSFTADHNELKRALARMPGQGQGSIKESRFGYNVALSEALDIANEETLGVNSFTLKKVAIRECSGLSPNDQQQCISQIQADSLEIQQTTQQNTERTILSIRQILTTLKKIDAPKTLILVSGGMVLFDAESEVLALGSLAAEARTAVYVLSADGLTQDQAARPIPGAALNDKNLLFGGLDLLASASRGALLNVVGNGATVLSEIESELSGYYLLGVEYDPADKDGKPHPVNVSVNRRGLSVRSRRQILAPPDKVQTSPREALTAGLVSPLILSGLPLQVATFSVREPESDKVQVVIHADVGTDYPAAKPVSIEYVITDKNGRVVETLTEDKRLPPTMTGVPSPLQFASTASLPPGDYGLKIAVVEGDRVGTVEHIFHAGLAKAGTADLSDLMVGGPVSAENLLTPTVGYTVNYGTVQGYLEAYGSGSDSLTVKYEVATSATAEPLLQTDVLGRSAGKERTIFSSNLAVGRLPRGKYVLRAIVSSGGQPVDSLSRTFEIAPPPVLMTSADSAVAAPVVTDVYLPVADASFQRPFRRDDASRGDTLRLFRESVTPASRDAFDKGASALASGDYRTAEQSFKSAVSADDQSSVALAYLAATYAASGHDNEAASAWQTSLIDGSEFPQIYEWLGDTLLRLHDLAGAKTVLEEAAAKWPGDVRFAKPLALVYATFGQGVQAVRTIERHLAVHQDDLEGLALGVEWMYHLHAVGVKARTTAQDVTLARGWADAYLKAKGPQAGLVKEWLQAIDIGR